MSNHNQHLFINNQQCYLTLYTEDPAKGLLQLNVSVFSDTLEPLSGFRLNFNSVEDFKKFRDMVSVLTAPELDELEKIESDRINGSKNINAAISKISGGFI